MLQLHRDLEALAAVSLALGALTSATRPARVWPVMLGGVTRWPLHFGKLTWQWNMDPLKMYFLLKMEIFQPAMLVYQMVAESILISQMLHGVVNIYLYFFLNVAIFQLM